MDFKDELKQLEENVIKMKDIILTEEATKNAFIMPFIMALGYNVFNPIEVVPEFVSDIGLKKGEKIDYAIFKDGNPIILIECKHWAQNLSIHDGQLLRYFHTSKSKFGLLTNGIIYRFYTDLVEPNKMDEKPFLEFNITDLKENQIEELKKFHKSYFNIESIFASASELKYTNELKQVIQQELSNPSAEFVKHFAKQVYPSVITAKVLEQFTTLIKKSIQQHISDLITERLKSALQKEDDNIQIPLSTNIDNSIIEKDVKVTTTEIEIEAFLIVKSILRQRVNVNRIFHRDTQSYLSVLIDDNKLKLICRLYLDGNKKYIGIWDDNKKEIKSEIQSIDDVYLFSEDLLRVLDTIEKPKGE